MAADDVGVVQHLDFAAPEQTMVKPCESCGKPLVTHWLQPLARPHVRRPQMPPLR